MSSGKLLEIIASTRKFVSSGGALGNELADLLGETEYIRGSSKYNQVNPLIIFNHSVFVDIFECLRLQVPELFEVITDN